MNVPPPLVMSMGEPAGIGGEISLKSWLHLHNGDSPFFIIDDPARLQRLATNLKLDVPVQAIDAPNVCRQVFPDALPVLPLENAVSATSGKPSEQTATQVLESIERACAIVQSGQAGGLVTNPIQKEALYKAGFHHPGHTEFVAELSGGGTPVMMLASPMLRVVPVTVHESLRHALNRLTTDLIVEKGRITLDALRKDFGIDRPRLAVAGLNPHAGENGTLGTEDREIIAPAIKALATENAEVFGPVPPDALFTARARDGYDAALCMYHDQALIPIKALDFDRAVNVTLGLPIVRTSPDHGTGLDIAGKGVADPSSMIAAIHLASEMIQHRGRSDAV